MEFKKVTDDLPEGFYWLKDISMQTPMPANLRGGNFYLKHGGVATLRAIAADNIQCAPIEWPKRKLSKFPGQAVPQAAAAPNLLDQMSGQVITVDPWNSGGDLPAARPVPEAEPEAAGRLVNPTNLDGAWILKAAIARLKQSGRPGFILDPGLLVHHANDIAGGKFGPPADVVKRALDDGAGNYCPICQKHRSFHLPNCPSFPAKQEGPAPANVAAGPFPLEGAEAGGPESNEAELLAKIQKDVAAMKEKNIASIQAVENMQQEKMIEALKEMRAAKLEVLPQGTKTFCHNCRWRPIGTAPKNYDIPILVAGPDNFVGVGRYFEVEDKLYCSQILKWDRIKEKQEPIITHWQPIPAGPIQ